MMEGQEGEGDFDPMADPEERKHLLSVLDSFRSYRRLAHFNGTHVRRQAFYSLPREHWMLLSRPPFSVPDSLSRMDGLIDSNAMLADAIFVAGFKTFLAPTISSDWVASIVPEKYAHDEYRVCCLVMDRIQVQHASPSDLDKARSCVNQFYREWSAQGARERAKCFDPVIAVLEAEFAARAREQPTLDRSDLCVLAPGSGLGRFVFDVCRAGFRVQGNEISYHELMASSLMLNHVHQAEQFTLAPFALNGSNHRSRADQFQTFAIPDIHPSAELLKAGPSKVPGHERMSMATGDFCVVYSQKAHSASFDAVATIFFLDTAPNLIRYIEAVRNCLKPGGIWINLGPLLWHHAARSQDKKEEEGEEKEEKEKETDSNDYQPSTASDAGIADPGTVELTNEEVLALVEHMGFTIEQHEPDMGETGYISNPKSMLQSTYRPSFWTARKGTRE